MIVATDAHGGIYNDTHDTHDSRYDTQSETLCDAREIRCGTERNPGNLAPRPKSGVKILL